MDGVLYTLLAQSIEETDRQQCFPDFTRRVDVQILQFLK